jgi:hypothetical protein
METTTETTTEKAAVIMWKIVKTIKSLLYGVGCVIAFFVMMQLVFFALSAFGYFLELTWGFFTEILVEIDSLIN